MKCEKIFMDKWFPLILVFLFIVGMPLIISNIHAAWEPGSESPYPATMPGISTSGLDADPNTTATSHSNDRQSQILIAIAAKVGTGDSNQSPAEGKSLVGQADGSTDYIDIYTQAEADAQGYQQVIYVAKGGGDYTTIQGALDHITDASITNRYVVKVQSGIYNECVTLKDYVDIVGAGRTNTIIAGTSGTILIYPANKCTVSELGVNMNYGTLGANSSAIVSAGADSVMKDCDITVTKSGGNFTMYGIDITDGAFRMSDTYFTYTDTGATGVPRLTQSAIRQSGILTTVILNNNEITASTTDTDDDLVGFETTATVVGTCLLANNVITIDAGAYGASATGIWAYGTASGAIFNQNRLTINCNGSAYGLWIDSAEGGAVIDTRHNEIIVTSEGAALSAFVGVGDTWNSTFDKVTAASGYTNDGTIYLSYSPTDGGFTATGTIEGGIITEGGTDVYNITESNAIYEIANILRMSMEYPTSGDNLTIGSIRDQMVVDQVTVITQRDANENVTFQIKHGTDRSGAGSSLLTTDYTAEATTARAIISTFDVDTVVTGADVWIEITANSGDVEELAISIIPAIP